MAKKYKYPKRPKASASTQVWERYEAKCKEVDKKNAGIVSDQKKKEGIMKRTAARRSK